MDKSAHNTTEAASARDDDGAPTQDQMYTMFTRAGMSVRNAERAVERLFTFDDREWTRGDLIKCASSHSGSLLVRVLQELRMPGIDNADVQRGIINDDFWGPGYDDNMSSGQEDADSRRGVF